MLPIKRNKRRELILLPCRSWKNQRHEESVLNKKAILKAIIVDVKYPNLVAKRTPKVKISNVIMMNWYWEGDNMAPLGTRLFQKNDEKYQFI